MRAQCSHLILKASLCANSCLHSTDAVTEAHKKLSSLTNVETVRQWQSLILSPCLLSTVTAFNDIAEHLELLLRDLGPYRCWSKKGCSGVALGADCLGGCMEREEEFFLEMNLFLGYDHQGQCGAARRSQVTR